MPGSIADSPRALAETRGYFAAEGLKVETSPFSTTQDALPLLATDKLDLMVGALNPAVFNALARNITVQVVADGGSIAPGFDWEGMAVRKDLLDSGHYKTPSDLKGMQIGVPGPYSVLHYIVAVLLEKHQLTLNDVHIEPVGTTDGVTAMATKHIDALASIEPFISITEQQNTGKVVLRSLQIMSNPPGGMFFMGQDFPTKRQQAAERYLIAWLRGVRDYLGAFSKNVNREQTIADLKQSKITILSFAQNPYFHPDGTFPVSSIQGLLDWYRKENAVKEQVDLSKLVNFDLTKAASAKLGPYSG